MKKGLAEIITAVLLIVLVIAMGVITFSVLKGITGEVIILENKNIELTCQDVKFQLAYKEGILYLSNIGNIEIYQIKAKIFKETGYQTINTDEFLENWPLEGLNSGGAFSSSTNFDQDVQKVIILPVLRGKTTKEIEKVYTCPEIYGKEINP